MQYGPHQLLFAEVLISDHHLQSSKISEKIVITPYSYLRAGMTYNYLITSSWVTPVLWEFHQSSLCHVYIRDWAEIWPRHQHIYKIPDCGHGDLLHYNWIEWISELTTSPHKWHLSFEELHQSPLAMPARGIASKCEWGINILTKFQTGGMNLAR